MPINQMDQYSNIFCIIPQKKTEGRDHFVCVYISGIMTTTTKKEFAERKYFFR